MFKLMSFWFSFTLSFCLLVGCATFNSSDSSSQKEVTDGGKNVGQVEESIQTSGSRFSDYRLGSGDLVSVQVFGEAEMSIDRARLSDAGTISYPFLGELTLLDLTAGQAEKVISDRLSGDYLIDPQVNVTVLEYRQFYVNGEVRSPGGFPFRPGLTIRKALALSGGLTDRASSRSFFVISEGVLGTQKADLTYIVKPGDIITVRESFF